MWMKSWSSSTSRPQPSAIPDLRRPNIRIGRARGRRHAVQVDRVREESSADLDLTQRHIIGKRPVVNACLGLGPQQIAAGRSAAGTRKKQERR